MFWLKTFEAEWVYVEERFSKKLMNVQKQFDE